MMSRKIVISTLIAVFWITTSLLLTNIRAEVSMILTLPHEGLETSGTWDNFSNDKRDGGIIYISRETGQEIFITYQEINRRKDEIRLNQPAIKKELWIRNIIPPSSRQFCYTDNLLACKWADKDISVTGDWSEWYDYLADLGMGLLISLIIGSMVWYFAK